MGIDHVVIRVILSPCWQLYAGFSAVKSPSTTLPSIYGIWRWQRAVDLCLSMEFWAAAVVPAAIPSPGCLGPKC